MKVCPACHRPFHTAKRTCASCDKPILRNHRWHVDGCYIRHDDCSNPTLAPLQEDAPLLCTGPETHERQVQDGSEY